MITKNKKHAFTLAEVMIVLLILTILFAAMAPFITKRKKSSSAFQELWFWSSRNYLAGPMNAYYNPNEDHLGGIFIGTTPDSDIDIKSSYTPLSKLVVRSGYLSDNLIQKQLQLRFGRDNQNDPGQLAATFLADNSNLLFGNYFKQLKEKSSNDTYPLSNLAFGYNALEDISNETSKIENNVAFGHAALEHFKGKSNTAFGANTGNILGSSANLNTFIGYKAGEKATSSGNTFVGAFSASEAGEYNTFIGAETGYNENNKYTDSYICKRREGCDPQKDTCKTCFTKYGYNVAVGYGALNNILTGDYNVAIGSGALANLGTGSYNVAIGYNACSGLTEQSYVTCIGANSGPATNSAPNAELGIETTDTTLRTYIGSNPNLVVSDGTWNLAGKYGGDAVLEIHNAGTNNRSLLNEPSISSNVTTIINGNLIVRGKTYLTMGDVLYPFYYFNNIFGTKLSEKCAENQATYAFNITEPRCSDLEPIANTSDRRLKNISSKNIDGLAKINQLKIYNYTLKDDKQKKPHVGVLAQELQKIFPNSVFKDDQGFLKIRWDEMFYAAINSIKELNTKIAELSKKLTKVESKINKMEKENEILKTQVEALSSRITKLKNK